MVPEVGLSHGKYCISWKDGSRGVIDWYPADYDSSPEVMTLQNIRWLTKLFLDMTCSLFVIFSLQHAFFLTNLHIKSSSCWHFCTTTRHFSSNSTSRDVFFKTNFALSRPPVDDFCATTKLFLDMTCSLFVFFRFKTPFSWQICTLSRHLVDIFARWPVTLRLIPRHETSFLDKFRIESTTCWRFLRNDSSLYI